MGSAGAAEIPEARTRRKRPERITVIFPFYSFLFSTTLKTVALAGVSGTSDIHFQLFPYFVGVTV